MARDQIKAYQEALADIETDGRFTPADVVEVARAPDHIFHDRFNWDDTAAAVQYRLHQARQLVNSIKCTFQVEEDTVITAAYVKDPAVGNEQQGYVSVLRIKQEPSNSALMVLHEFSQADAHLSRAASLAEVVGDKAGEVQKLQARIKRLGAAIERRHKKKKT